MPIQSRGAFLQLRATARLLDFLGIKDQSRQDVVGKLFNRNTFSFDGGQIADWREAFTNKHCRLAGAALEMCRHCTDARPIAGRLGLGLADISYGKKGTQMTDLAVRGGLGLDYVEFYVGDLDASIAFWEGRYGCAVAGSAEDGAGGFRSGWPGILRTHIRSSGVSSTRSCSIMHAI